jgi:maleamate amidohydrolase
MLNDESLADNYSQTFNGKSGMGKRPAIIAIDFMKSYTTKGSPFYAEGVVEAVKHAQRLYASARKHGIPIYHTCVVFLPNGEDGGVFIEKLPALRQFTEGSPLGEFDISVVPLESEAIIKKQYPSAFFGTPLVSMLVKTGIDTVILAGCSTSGCIRASSVDAISYGFRVVVPRECVGDRHSAPHEANLFDINAKYGDVMLLEDVIALFEGQTV